MIIEHEAAGTLLKSTENRAGGFTCRINFYLVSNLPRPVVLVSLFLSTPFSSPCSQSLTPHYTDRDRFSCLPIAFSPDHRQLWNLPLLVSRRRLLLFFSLFSFFTPGWTNEITRRSPAEVDFSRTSLISPRCWTRLFVCRRRRRRGWNRESSRVMKIFLRQKLNFTVHPRVLETLFEAVGAWRNYALSQQDEPP